MDNQARTLLDQAYEEVDHIISKSTKLDAKFLMYIKSYLGPIEEFMSPEIEPAGLHNLIGEGIL